MAETITLFEHEVKEYDWTDRDLCRTGAAALCDRS